MITSSLKFDWFIITKPVFHQKNVGTVRATNIFTKPRKISSGLLLTKEHLKSLKSLTKRFCVKL